MPRKREIRTVLGLRIRESRLSVEEFAQRLEEFSWKNKEVGTLSLRHVHRLVAGKLEPQQLRPATVRLLEGFLGCSIEELLSPADKSARSSIDDVDRVDGQVPARPPSALAVVRKRLGYSQESFAEAVGVDTTTVGRWERGAQVPQPWLRPKIAKALKITDRELVGLVDPPGAPTVSGTGIPVFWPDAGSTGTEAATPGGDPEMPVDRRSFLSIAAVAAVDAGVVQDFTASIAGGDAGPLTKVQTTYDVDAVIASMLDRATENTLLRWTEELGNPVARVNAAGILAKTPDQRQSGRVVAILRNDDEVQRLYLTAVTARVCAMKWDQAARFIESPIDFPFASIAVGRFAREVLNPADVGARWCSAKMLQDLSPAIGR